MKKEKIISEKKAIKNNIKLSLVSGLKAIAGKFGDVSEKLEKEINQGAKKLAKAIAKEIKAEEPAQTETAPAAKAEPEKKVAPASKAAPVNKVAHTSNGAPENKVAPAKKVADKTAKPAAKKGKPATA
jgi:hypothetical protein